MGDCDGKPSHVQMGPGGLGARVGDLEGLAVGLLLGLIGLEVGLLVGLLVC